MTATKPIEVLMERAGPGESSGQPLPKITDSTPAILSKIWGECGLRWWFDGFIWLTDPHEFKGILGLLNQDEENGVVFARTGLGDMFIWQFDGVYLANVRMGSVDNIEEDIGLVINYHLSDAEFHKKVLGSDLYTDARRSLPRPNWTQCYGFVPLPQLGGSGSAETLKIVEMIPYLESAAQR